VHVLAQLDTACHGTDAVTALLELGVPQQRINGLRWIVSVQRLPTLCPRCKRPQPHQAGQASEFLARYPDIFGDSEPTLYVAEGCPYCRHTGRHGDVAAFDIFRLDEQAADQYRRSSVLPLEEYAFRLAAEGQLSLQDVSGLEADQLRRAYNMLTASERALGDANATLMRKLAELEAANRVLQQRTEALISLQDVGQALISSTDLDDLAARVCHRACDICCADRAIVYYLLPPSEAEILAVNGWDPALLHQRLDSSLLLQAGSGHEPTLLNDWPPGVPTDFPEGETPLIRAGCYVPLVAQEELIGVMLVHSTEAYHFTPGEIALLQAFANQAALAIQRAGLIDQLRSKISELEAAQVELAQKERLERELELARQVQQSVLPHTFPAIPGYLFAARNEPARQVGGDFYDLIVLDDGHFAVLVGDVSDKGMPSALYMALTRSLILAEARREASPVAVLASVNQLLLELAEPNMFVSVFYGVIERSSRQMVYARAGHDPPLLLRHQRVLEVGGQGRILGIFDRERLGLSQETMTLSAGDRLVLYTDGLTDVVQANGDLFDREKLKKLLLSNASLSPDRLCAATFAELAAYQGASEQFDDMTMLVVAVQ
jgi:serine phosphatase RsbU (regulator of sigma subunit)